MYNNPNYTTKFLTIWCQKFKSTTLASHNDTVRWFSGLWGFRTVLCKRGTSSYKRLFWVKAVENLDVWNWIWTSCWCARVNNPYAMYARFRCFRRLSNLESSKVGEGLNYSIYKFWYSLAKLSLRRVIVPSWFLLNLLSRKLSR